LANLKLREKTLKSLCLKIKYMYGEVIYKTIPIYLLLKF